VRDERVGRADGWASGRVGEVSRVTLHTVSCGTGRASVRQLCAGATFDSLDDCKQAVRQVQKRGCYVAHHFSPTNGAYICQSTKWAIQDEGFVSARGDLGPRDRQWWLAARLRWGVRLCRAGAAGGRTRQAHEAFGCDAGQFTFSPASTPAPPARACGSARAPIAQTRTAPPRTFTSHSCPLLGALGHNRELALRLPPLLAFFGSLSPLRSTLRTILWPLPRARSASTGCRQSIGWLRFTAHTRAGLPPLLQPLNPPLPLPYPPPPLRLFLPPRPPLPPPQPARLLPPSQLLRPPLPPPLVRVSVASRHPQTWKK
jgi:hypothetical protein